MNRTVKIIVDGRPCAVREGEPLLPVLQAEGFNIPALCHHSRLDPLRRCSLCIIEVHSQGQWTPNHACTVLGASGLEIRTVSPGIHRLRALAAQMMLARGPFRDQSVAVMLNEVLTAAEAAGVPWQAGRDTGHGDGLSGDPAASAMAKGCILCGRCIAICRKIGRNYLTFLNKGKKLQISYAPGAASRGCGACKACAKLCPTAFIRTNGQTTFTAKLYRE